MNKAALLRWGYQHEDRGIRFLTNVIQCQCGRQAKKLLGLFKLVTTGNEVRCGQFSLFNISINGHIQDISELEKYA